MGGGAEAAEKLREAAEEAEQRAERAAQEAPEKGERERVCLKNPGEKEEKHPRGWFPGVEPEQGAEEPQQPDPVGLPEEAQPDREEPQTQHQEKVGLGGWVGGWEGSAPVTGGLSPATSEPHEPAQRELTALDREIEKQTVQLREWQMQELLNLRQPLHALEQETQRRHQQEVTTAGGRRAARWTPTHVAPPSVCCRPSRS